MRLPASCAAPSQSQSSGTASASRQRAETQRAPFAERRPRGRCRARSPACSSSTLRPTMPRSQTPSAIRPGDVVVAHQQQVDRQRFAVAEQAVAALAPAQAAGRQQRARRLGQAAGFLDGDAQAIARRGDGWDSWRADLSGIASGAALAAQRGGVAAGAALERAGDAADGGDADPGAVVDLAVRHALAAAAAPPASGRSSPRARPACTGRRGTRGCPPGLRSAASARDKAIEVGLGIAVRQGLGALFHRINVIAC